MTTDDRASALLALHRAPEVLVLANVWDVVSAQVVAAVDGVGALATASHSIASTFGYPDGENIPLDLHLDMVGRITRAVDLPVSMDLEGGYGDPVVTAQRDGHLHGPARGGEHLVQAGVEAELLDRLVELVQRAVERGHACGHAKGSDRSCAIAVDRAAGLRMPRRGATLRA